MSKTQSRAGEQPRAKTLAFTQVAAWRIANPLIALAAGYLAAGPGGALIGLALGLVLVVTGWWLFRDTAGRGR